MKIRTYFFALGMMAATNALAVTPNNYVCKGEDFEMAFSRAGLNVQQKAVYKKPSLNLVLERTYDGVNVLQTPVGELVTLVVASTPTLSSERVSVLLPHINLTGAINELTFSTNAISSVHYQPSGGTTLPSGLIHKNTMIPVECIASFTLGAPP